MPKVESNITKPTLEDLRQLLEHASLYAVSIHIPTDEVGLEPTKRKAQLQNAEREIVEQLEALHAPAFTQQQIQRNLYKLYEQDELWEVEQKGLVLFVSSTFARLFQLPIEVKYLAQVSSRFHIKPIIRLVTEPLHFYLLSLSMDSAVMYEGDRYELKKVTIPNMPDRVEAVVGTETDRTPHPAAQHGHPPQGVEDKHRYTKRFLQAVDKAVSDYLEHRKTPLLLTGTERVITLYMEVTHYPHVLQQTLRDNDKSMSLPKVHKEVVELMEQHSHTRKKAELSALMDKGDNAMFSDQVDEILREAELGRVDTVVVAQGEREWGKFDQSTLSVSHGEKPAARDLLDTVCAVTLLRGGKAYVLPLDQMPEHKTAIAVFRY
jgi:hypothetical protein